MKATLLLLAIAALFSCKSSEDILFSDVVSAKDWQIINIVPTDDNFLYEFTPTDEIYQFTGWIIWQVLPYHTLEVGTYTDDIVIMWECQYKIQSFSPNQITIYNNDVYIYFGVIEE